MICEWIVGRLLGFFVLVIAAGFGKDLAAAVLVDCLEEGLLGQQGDTKNQALRRTWLDLKAWCKLRRVLCPPRVFSMNYLGRSQSNKAFPCIESAVKGAHMRPILGFLADLTRTHDVPGCSEEARLRAALCWATADFLYVLDTGGRWLDRPFATRGWEAGTTMLLAYQQLAAIAQAEGRSNYKLRPKAHGVAHAVDQLSVAGAVENPRMWQVFNEEDFIGKISTIAGKCSIRTVMSRLIQRYTLQLARKWPTHDGQA